MNRRDANLQPAFIVIEGKTSRVHNEPAFRYFLDVERQRAELVHRQLLLVLVSVRGALLAQPPFGTATARAVLDALDASVREVDLVGWYRDGFIAGALVHIGGVADDGARKALCSRVSGTLQHRLNKECSRLRVRVLAVGRKPAN